MKYYLEIKDNKVANNINLPNGTYDCEIKIKDKSHTIEQIKKLWATIDDISKAQYGNTSMSEEIYFQILSISGVETTKFAIREEAVKDLRKKVRTLVVIGNEVINHIPYSIVNVCFKGVSEMSKSQLSKIIETTIKYGSELGLDMGELEEWK